MIEWKNIFHHKGMTNSLKGKRIGIIGLGARNGATHIAISLCNYLSDCRRYKVCLLEQNTSHDLLSLKGYLNINSSSNNEFEFHRVFYYPNIPHKEAPSRLTSSFDCTVFDLGHDFRSAYRTLELCDIRIVVGAGSPWREYEYSILETLFSKGDSLENWLLFINLGTKEQVAYYAKYGIPTYPFPYEPDPISPNEETINTYERLLV